MEVGFPLNALWLALFFLISPFAPARVSARRVVRELPGAGWLRALRRFRSPLAA